MCDRTDSINLKLESHYKKGDQIQNASATHNYHLVIRGGRAHVSAQMQITGPCLIRQSNDT